MCYLHKKLNLCLYQGDILYISYITYMLNVDATNQPIYVFTADMSLLLEQTSNRGEWAVPCLQTGMSLFTLSHFATLGWILFSMNKHTFMSQLS